SLADRTMHLWRFDLPDDLDAGQHTAEVTATDSYGREFTDVLEFEAVDRRRADSAARSAAGCGGPPPVETSRDRAAVAVHAPVTHPEWNSPGRETVHPDPEARTRPHRLTGADDG